MYENINTSIQMVNTRKMVVDYDYQRKLDPLRVKKIASNFNPLLVNEIKVSFRGGKYYIFDGQHTTAALKLRNGNMDLDVSCKVFFGLTKADEAKLFSQQNGDLARAVPSNAKMKALYTSGDVDVATIKDIVEKEGLIFDFSQSQGNNKIICCSLIYKLYRSMPQTDLSEVLRILKTSWNGERDSMRGEIVEGLAILYTAQKNKFSSDHAIKAFSKESPNSVIRAGKEFESSRGGIRFARALLRIYNKGKTSGKRLDENSIIEFKWGRK